MTCEASINFSVFVLSSPPSWHVKGFTLHHLHPNIWSERECGAEDRGGECCLFVLVLAAHCSLPLPGMNIGWRQGPVMGWTLPWLLQGAACAKELLCGERAVAGPLCASWSLWLPSWKPWSWKWQYWFSLLLYPGILLSLFLLRKLKSIRLLKMIRKPRMRFWEVFAD